MDEFVGTKGPWVASNSDRSIGPVCRDDDQSYGMILPVAWVEFDDNPGHHQANAHLIAAAPELLEALQELVHADTHGIKNCSAQVSALEKAKSAIAKALGK